MAITRNDGRSIALVEALVGDATGCILLSIKQGALSAPSCLSLCRSEGSRCAAAELVKTGNVLSVGGGRVNMVAGTPRLAAAELKLVPGEGVEPLLELNLSLLEYDTIDV